MKSKNATSNKKASLFYLAPLLLLFLFTSFSANAQNSARLDSLRESRAALQKELKTLNSARESAKTEKEASLTEIQLISKQIMLREELLKTMQREVRQLVKEIDQTTESIAALEEEVKEIQDEHGRLMVVIYKAMHQKSTSFYLLSASSITQGYKRLLYFKAISALQESQVKLLKRTKAFLDEKKVELELRKSEKQALVDGEKKEKAKLTALKAEQKRMYEQLKKDEEEYAKQIQQTKASLAALNKAIDKEIKRLIALNKPKNSTEKDVILAMNKDFAKNKGRLPWPLPKSSGSVSRKFGTQTLAGSNTKIDLQGIDITTRKDQAIRAIFKGKVAQVMPVPGQGKIVIVQHGDYYSVYANLQDVLVTSGQTVDMLQTLGTARTESETGETKIHFQLYKARDPQNPELWLVK